MLALSRKGIWTRGIGFDTMVASYVLRSEGQHNLDALAKEHLNYKNGFIRQINGGRVRRDERGLKGTVEPPQRSDEREASQKRRRSWPSIRASDSSLVVSVQQLLSVEPFFVADLRAEVPGQVRYVQKDIGDPVSSGEILVAIDVPHLDQELLEKESVIKQRRQDLRVARPRRRTPPPSWMSIAKSLTSDGRNWNRPRPIATTTSFASRGSRVWKMAVQSEYPHQGRGDELSLQGSASRAPLPPFARLRPICAKRVGPAHRASRYRTEAKSRRCRPSRTAIGRAPWSRTPRLPHRLTAWWSSAGGRWHLCAERLDRPIRADSHVARTDIVTLVMKVPDNAAPYVTRDTEAVIQIDELPGVVIRGKVTRFSPWIHTSTIGPCASKSISTTTPRSTTRSFGPMRAAAPVGSPGGRYTAGIGVVAERHAPDL